MTPATVAVTAMLAAGVCYVVAAVAFLADGKPWTAATIFMYALCCVTIWMAGAH